MKYQTNSDHVQKLKNKITEYKSNNVKQYPVFIKLHLKESKRNTETITQFYLIVQDRVEFSRLQQAVLMINNSNLVSH